MNRTWGSRWGSRWCRLFGSFLTSFDLILEKTHTPFWASQGTTVPIITRTEYTLVDVGEEGELTLMDEAGETREDLNLPKFPENYGAEIRKAFEADKVREHCAPALVRALTLNPRPGYTFDPDPDPDPWP